MCRLFGLLGSPGASPEPWLKDTECSLLAQSHVSEEEAQRDGWGVAWFDERRAPRIVKGTAGAFEASESPRYFEAARKARGPVVVGHLRHASNPMGLSRERLIGLENSQPFVDGSHLFVHNGSIPFPRETRPLLGKFEERIKGVNDSEVLFYLLLRHTTELGNPLAAFIRARSELVDVWHSRGSPKTGPYSGLNVIFARGPNEIWVFCDSLGEHGPGLCQRNRPYYEMAYLADAKQIVVASEPLDRQRNDWRSLKNGQYLHGRVAGGLVVLETGAIPAPAAVPAPV